ncbi:MAG: glycosyltransferase [Oligoflexia bacterium]|nr:glycosyltransferase [Oligoflexia bacterium]
MNTKISIVVPTHNRSFSVERFLESLKKQTLSRDRFSIYIAMNTKDVELESRLEKWKDEFTISWGATGELGVNKARNLGIINSSSDIVLLFDDDMELVEPDTLEQHIRIHADENVKGLGGGCRMPSNATLPALAYHIIGMSWMLRYAKENGETPYLLGGHASYKKEIFKETMFNSDIAFGAAETEFNLRLYNAGKVLKFEPEIRPIHHNDVSFRNFIKKAYLQGYNGATRRATHVSPDPVMKYEKALNKILSIENPRKWQIPGLKFYFWLYAWASDLGAKVCQNQECSQIQLKTLKWLARIK